MPSSIPSGIYKKFYSGMGSECCIGDCSVGSKSIMCALVNIRHVIATYINVPSRDEPRIEICQDRL